MLIKVQSIVNLHHQASSSHVDVVERERKVRFQHQESSPFDEEVVKDNEENEEEEELEIFTKEEPLADVSLPEDSSENLAQNTSQTEETSQDAAAATKKDDDDDDDDDLLNIKP